MSKSVGQISELVEIGYSFGVKLCSGKWKWWVVDMNSGLHINEASGFSGSQFHAKYDCKSALLRIVKKKLTDLETFIEDLEKADGIEWSEGDLT